MHTATEPPPEHKSRAPTRPATPAYLGSFVAMGVCTMLLGPSLETLGRTTHTATANIGILFTASSIGYLLGVAASGQWLNTRSAHPALVMGMVTMTVAVTAIPMAHSLQAVFGCEVLLGFGIGWIEIPANSAILWGHGGGRAINALHASFAIGAVCAPIIVGRSIAWSHGLRLGYLVAGIIALCPIFALRSGRAPENPHVDHGRGIPRGTRRLTAIGTTFFFFYVGAEMSFAGWIYKYVADRGVASGTTTTVFGAAFLGAFAIGRIGGVPIARHLSAARTLYIDHLVSGFALAILLIGGSNVVALFIGTALFGLGLASMFASMLSLSERHVAPTGTVTSVYLIGSSVGTMTIPWFTGRLFARYGPGALPTVAGIGICATLFTVVAFQRSAQQRANRLG